MRQSSANRLVVELTIPSRSLMYTRNSKGPRAVPCGTLGVTGDDEDVFPSRTTCWALPLRKPLITQGCLHESRSGVAW